MGSRRLRESTGLHDRGLHCLKSLGYPSILRVSTLKCSLEGVNLHSLSQTAQQARNLGLSTGASLALSRYHGRRQLGIPCVRSRPNRHHAKLPNFLSKTSEGLAVRQCSNEHRSNFKRCQGAKFDKCRSAHCVATAKRAKKYNQQQRQAEYDHHEMATPPQPTSVSCHWDFRCASQSYKAHLDQDLDGVGHSFAAAAELQQRKCIHAPFRRKQGHLIRRHLLRTPHSFTHSPSDVAGMEARLVNLRHGRGTEGTLMYHFNTQRRIAKNTSDLEHSQKQKQKWIAEEEAGVAASSRKKAGQGFLGRRGG